MCKIERVCEWARLIHNSSKTDKHNSRARIKTTARTRTLLAVLVNQIYPGHQCTGKSTILYFVISSNNWRISGQPRTTRYRIKKHTRASYENIPVNNTPMKYTSVPVRSELRNGGDYPRCCSYRRCCGVRITSRYWTAGNTATPANRPGAGSSRATGFRVKDTEGISCVHGNGNG